MVAITSSQSSPIAQPAIALPGAPSTATTSALQTGWAPRQATVVDTPAADKLARNASDLGAATLLGQTPGAATASLRSADAGSQRTVITQEQAEQLFKQLAGADFKDTEGEQIPLPFHFPDDGCYGRAQIMDDILRGQGIIGGKVFALGNATALKVPSAYGDDVPADQQPTVTWGWHVAPVLDVKDASGKITTMVFDPSIESKPVTIDQWLDTMGDSESFEHLTERQAEAKFKAGQLEQPGKNVVYQTDSGAFYPSDDPDATDSAGETNLDAVRGRLENYEDQARVHELAKAVRDAMAAPKGRAVNDMLDAVKAAPDETRAQLWKLFPDLEGEASKALGDDVMTQLDGELAA